MSNEKCLSVAKNEHIVASGSRVTQKGRNWPKIDNYTMRNCAVKGDTFIEYEQKIRTHYESLFITLSINVISILQFDIP